MSTITQRIVARFLAQTKVAREEPFNRDVIEKLRKEFLLLMKNVDRVKTVDDADKLREGARAWARYYENFLENSLLPMVTLAVRQWLSGKTTHDPAYDDEEVRLYKEWTKRLYKEASPLRAAVNAIPYDPWDRYGDGSGRVLAFVDWNQGKKAWSERCKREARKAWNVFDAFIEFLATGANPTAPMHVVTEEVRHRIQGFDVLVRGFEPDDEIHVNKLAMFAASLKDYRGKAAQVMPILLRAQLPFFLDFTSACDVDKAGEYLGTHILMCAAPSGVRATVKTLAHEMGHHLYRNYLSDQDKKYWSAVIDQDRQDFDLRDLLPLWKTGENIHDLYDRLSDTNPILALQLGIIIGGYDQSMPEDVWYRREDLVQYLDGGGSPLVRMPQNPITPYSRKNDEEAFCEALGMLVSYGPSTVFPAVRTWFQNIMPGVRIAYDRGKQGSRGSV